MTTSPAGGTTALERALRASVRGDVRFDAATRALYAADASAYRHVPIAVVTPLDEDDVVAAVGTCRDHAAPILPRGAGTSLAGQCCNVAVVLDLRRHLDRVLAVDPEARTATVQPGVTLDDLRAAASVHGLTFGPDPATHDRCTLGGMIGNNACGVRSLSWGRTSDNVESLDVVTSDGFRLRVGRGLDVAGLEPAAVPRAEAIGVGLRSLAATHGALVREKFPRIPRRVSGYNLDDLQPDREHAARSLVGSEGTCATTLRATVRLVERPAATALVVLGFPSLVDAAACAPLLLPLRPHGLEGLDRHLVRDVGTGRRWRSDVPLPRGEAWLLVEMAGATRDEALSRCVEAARASGATRLICATEEDERGVWALREAGVGTTARLPDGRATWPGWEDSAVAPERLPAYLDALTRLLASHGLRAALYGHFGDGCVHARIDFDLETQGGVARFRRFLDEAADLVVAHGGSLSGEHGDGQARGALLSRMFGDELVSAMADFRRLWDPLGLMNPGKGVGARPPEEDLRAQGPAAPRLVPRLALAGDGGSLARATTRCVGVGKCVRTSGATMCPSYMATKDERHSTRGRARLLQEMLRGDVVTGGFADDDVHEALDLCLSCKACKTECPTGVDMALWKAEYLSRRHELVPRGLGERLLSRVDLLARAGSIVPGLANALAGLPIAKRLAGIAPSRRIPRLAPRTFESWWRARRARPQAGERGRLVLWPDTFTRYFEPDVGRSAVEVLEEIGFDVLIPFDAPCCGRPLFEAGRLDEARERARAIVATLRAPLEADAALAGLEPSCVAMLRDELLELLPGDPVAKRLAARASFFGELVGEHARRIADRLADRTGTRRDVGRVLLHGHCHQQALHGVAADARALEAAGLACVTLDAGCCGMAGAFGMRARSHALSLAIGERSLLPAARAMSGHEMLVTDGFSCREQVEQATGRRPLHLSQALHGALGLPEDPRW